MPTWISGLIGALIEPTLWLLLPMLLFQLLGDRFERNPSRPVKSEPPQH